MPKALGIHDLVDAGLSGYADDTICWQGARNAEEAVKGLEVLSNRMQDYAAKCKLALNPKKTQILIVGKDAKTISSAKIAGELVNVDNQLEFLGVTLDQHLRPNPFLRRQELEARRIAGLTRCLDHHFPPHYVATITRALLNGRLGYGAALLSPRQEEDSRNGLLKAIQCQINACARVITKTKREDCIRTDMVLWKAGIQSINRLIARSVAIEVWKTKSAMGDKLELANMLGETCTNHLRSGTAGHVQPPLRKKAETFIWTGYSMWNQHQCLRQAKSLWAAKHVASLIAEKYPL